MKNLLMILLCFIQLPVAAENGKPGEYLGAKTSETPHWFKQSFLEFEEDVAEAANQNKRVMLYFHQEGCPYCARLIEENFNNPDLESYIRKNFDGITINMWGDRDIVSVGGNLFTEKTFAEALKVQYTPTLLFLNEQGRVILRLNGYYPPGKFRQALHYVAEKQESKLSFNEFMLASQASKTGSLIGEDFFTQETNLKSLLNSADKPLAVYFESADCAECSTLHSRVLTDSPTRQLVNDMLNVQLNVHSDVKITTTDGKHISQHDYAKQLNIGYTPSVVLFDKQGKEVHRMEGFLKTFHFQSSLAYVLEQAYLTQPSFQRYISSRGEKLRELGYDTDIWGYKSSYPEN
ncbi:MAG: thioredoxin fold domain-containing protein [Gammaproteobacteria bacterium]|nr:thioredoxin fold domain-containing protein [Gammaproteobacteria bacterium]